MSVSARAGDAFPANGIGTPILVVDQNGNLGPLKAGGDPVSTNELNVPAAHTDAVITLAAVTGEAHIVSGIAWSYGGVANLPSYVAMGRLTIADGSDTIFDLDIGAPGIGSVVFDPPKRGRSGRAMTVTLADGGASVQGKVNLLGHWMVTVSASGALDFSDEANSGDLMFFF